MKNNKEKSIKNAIKIIQLNQKQGLTNNNIIQNLIKEEYCFQIIFDAMEKTKQIKVQ